MKVYGLHAGLGVGSVSNSAVTRVAIVFEGERIALFDDRTVTELSSLAASAPHEVQTSCSSRERRF